MQSILETVFLNNYNFFLSFGLNLIAIVIFTYSIYFRRHKRRDLFVTFTFFNIALFMIVEIIARTQLSIGIGFGLFAFLTIIRLRSEEFSNYEIGYFFGSLALAVVNGLGIGYALTIIMDIAILLSMTILDHPSLLLNVNHGTITLDTIYNDDEKIKKTLSKLLNAKILGFTVTDIDYVKDITRLHVQYRKETKT